VTIYRSSASQVSTFELCARKWAFGTIEGLRPPPNRFAAFGTAVHSHVQEWFERRLVPPVATPEGRAAAAIIRHLPPPQTPGIACEEEINPTIGGVPFKGFVDFRIDAPTPFVADHKTTSDLAWAPTPFVADHKTTSDLAWALDADDLAGDVQASLYAFDTMRRLDVQAVDLQWTYAERASAKTKVVARRVTLADIGPRINRTAETVKTMQQIFDAAPAALEVPYDAAGCEAFGGCPFRERCNLSPTERIQSVMSQENQHSAFLAKLRAKREGTNGAPVTPAAPAQNAAQQPVNPPDAPEPARAAEEPVKAASAPAAPAPAVVEPDADAEVKRRTFRQPKAPPASPPLVAALAALPVPATLAPVPGLAAPPAAVAPSMVAGDVLGLLNRQFAEGFKAGFAAGRSER
jgi:hypothetical protein